MNITPYFDAATWTLTYLVWDGDTRDAVIIDPVLDYDPLAVSVNNSSSEKVLADVQRLGLRVHWILDTHAHADHLSGFQFLKEKTGARIAIGREIAAVQKVFKGVFGLPESFPTDGRQWDALLEDGEAVEAGSLRIEPIHTPGHTPACYSFRIRDALFTGDALFMPDSGTGRCDFPGGSARELFASIQKLYALPDETRVFVGHDYQPGGREVRFESTIGESKRANIHLRGDSTIEEFVAFRNGRDATLRPPRLIFQSLQVNVDAGRLPEPDATGRRKLLLPMNVFG